MILGPPQQIDSATRAFCATISPADPFYVPVEPVPRAKVAYCFQNSQIQAVEQGGTAAYGWAIWRWPGRWFEAEHHAVWRDADGTWHDVTPQPGNTPRVLFLPDPDAIYDPRTFRPNVMGTDAENPLAREYISLAAERTAITRRYWRPCVDHLALFAPEDQRRLAPIDARMTELLAEMAE